MKFALISTPISFSFLLSNYFFHFPSSLCSSVSCLSSPKASKHWIIVFLCFLSPSLCSSLTFYITNQLLPLPKLFSLSLYLSPQPKSPQNLAYWVRLFSTGMLLLNLLTLWSTPIPPIPTPNLFQSFVTHERRRRRNWKKQYSIFLNIFFTKNSKKRKLKIFLLKSEKKKKLFSL